MNGALLQQKIYLGYGKAASRIGSLYDVYRPGTATNALAQINKQFSLFASFNAEDFSYLKPNKYGHPTWFGVFDGTQTRPGDYLVGPQGTWFIAAQQQALPILAVQTNRTINALRPAQVTGVGAQPYGGDTVATETPLMTGWPASVLQGTKGEKGHVNLPGDVRSPWWLILVPAFDGVRLRSGDIINDDLFRRYVISSAELTDLGWRLVAMQAQT